MAFLMYVNAPVFDTEVAGAMADDDEFAASVLRAVVKVVDPTDDLADELGDAALLLLEAWVRKLREHLT